MPESISPSPNGDPSTQEKAPPFVQVIKTPGGCQVHHNLIDDWLVIALLEMGKDTLMEQMRRAKLVKPPTTSGLAGFRAKMAGH